MCRERVYVLGAQFEGVTKESSCDVVYHLIHTDTTEPLPTMKLQIPKNVEIATFDMRKPSRSGVGGSL